MKDKDRKEEDILSGCKDRKIRRFVRVPLLTYRSQLFHPFVRSTEGGKANFLNKDKKKIPHG